MKRRWKAFAIGCLPLVMASCSSTSSSPPPTPSAVPSVTAEPTETPAAASLSPSPTASAELAAGGLAIDRIAVTTAEAVRVREEPAATAQQVSTLDAGTRVFLLEGPITDPADAGVEWWHVAPYACEGGCRDDPRSGWMSSGPDGEWLEPVALDCESSYTAADRERFHSSPEMLACHGNEPITLEGIVDYWCCSAIALGVTEPTWLAGPQASGYAMLRQGSEEGSAGWGPHMRVDPASSVVLGDRGTLARITGHYDDPAARTCVVTVSDQDRELNPDIAASITPESTVYACRLQFVVDDVEVIDVIPLPTHPPQG